MLLLRLFLASFLPCRLAWAFFYPIVHVNESSFDNGPTVHVNDSAIENEEGSPLLPPRFVQLLRGMICFECFVLRV